MKTNMKGFTLVEIMIVVAIIGLLIAIALPNFLAARVKAQTRACIANQRNIDSAIQQAMIETPGVASTWLTSALIGTEFLKNPTLVHCPLVGVGTFYICNPISNTLAFSCNVQCPVFTTYQDHHL